VTGDPVLAELLTKLTSYPGGDEQSTLQSQESDVTGVLVPLRLVTKVGVLALLSTTTLFGSVRDITLSELALEAFFPADAVTAELLRHLGSIDPG